MTNIASKNLFDLLGNDPDLDPDREPEPPTKAIDKPTQRAGKRNASAEGPASGTSSRARGGGRGGRQENYTGSEQAFRDRDAGRFNNRSKPADDGAGFGRGRGRGGARGGGRGGRGGAPRDDRHSKTGIAEHEKQAAHGWGGQTGGAEWADERAGEAIAKEEEKAGFDASVGPPVNADGEEFKPDLSGEGANDAWAPDAAGEDGKEPEEDKTKSYAAYLAEQTEKKLSLGLGELEARKPNEGRDKKFPAGKALARDENEENYMAGSGGKAARMREKKEKTRLQLDDERLLKAPELGGGRGGRGRGRGDSFRGDGGRGSGRGGRGDRGDRGGGRGFGGGGERGRGRGGRGGGNVNVNDQSAFPSLGS